MNNVLVTQQGHQINQFQRLVSVNSQRSPANTLPMSPSIQQSGQPQQQPSPGLIHHRNSMSPFASTPAATISPATQIDDKQSSLVPTEQQNQSQTSAILIEPDYNKLRDLLTKPNSNSNQQNVIDNGATGGGNDSGNIADIVNKHKILTGLLNSEQEENNVASQLNSKPALVDIKRSNNMLLRVIFILLYFNEKSLQKK